MQLATGSVIDGKIVLDGATLPDVTIVTVLAPDHDDPVRLPAHLTAELEAALAEADQDEGITAEQLFEYLRNDR
jgi:hypothetical protein